MWLDGAVLRVKSIKVLKTGIIVISHCNHTKIGVQLIHASAGKRKISKKKSCNKKFFQHPPVLLKTQVTKKIWSGCRAPAAGCLLNVLRADPAEKRKKEPQPREGVKRGGSLLEVLSR